MIYTSLAILAMSASALAAPLSHPFHMHPKMPDQRVCLTLVNTGYGFRDVKIDGKVYTMQQYGTLSVKAPIGTVIFADSRMPLHHRGDALLAVTQEMNNTKVKLN